MFNVISSVLLFCIFYVKVQSDCFNKHNTSCLKFSLLVWGWHAISILCKNKLSHTMDDVTNKYGSRLCLKKESNTLSQNRLGKISNLHSWKEIIFYWKKEWCAECKKRIHGNLYYLSFIWSVGGYIWKISWFLQKFSIMMRQDLLIQIFVKLCTFQGCTSFKIDICG